MQKLITKELEKQLPAPFTFKVKHFDLDFYWIHPWMKKESPYKEELEKLYESILNHTFIDKYGETTEADKKKKNWSVENAILDYIDKYEFDELVWHQEHTRRIDDEGYYILYKFIELSWDEIFPEEVSQALKNADLQSISEGKE